MTPVWIIVGILLALCFFCCLLCPITLLHGLKIGIERSKLRYLFFSLSAGAERKKAQEEAERANRKTEKKGSGSRHKKSKFKEILRKEGLSGF